jgi:aminopeptidase
MQDPRIDKLARVLINHSTRLEKGETVLIEAFDLPEPNLVCRLVELASERGAKPIVSLKNNTVLRSLYRSGSEAAIQQIGEIERERMTKCQAYIGIRGAANTNELSDVPAEALDRSQRLWWQPVHIQTRVPKTRWVVLRYPTSSMAQAAKMSTQAFEEYYFDVCTADYAEMALRQEPLKQRMLAADKVRIVGPGTDLSFSIKDIPVIPCNGRRNIPDGEVFTAPVKTSVNGVITYNTGSLYQGTVYEGIRFEFKDGKIVKAECRNDTDRLNQILDSDEGARYIGEWSLGCNNRVTKPMLDTLFDEKIGGSMHLTPGNAYETADNGNRSRVHWDLVLIQTPAYGGGEVWFDGQLVRRDGKFLPEDLLPLNEGME